MSYAQSKEKGSFAHNTADRAECPHGHDGVKVRAAAIFDPGKKSDADGYFVAAKYTERLAEVKAVFTLAQ